MILLIDIGNSNIVVSKYETSIQDVYRFNTDKNKSVDEYYVLLKDIIEGATGIAISSVVPEINIILKNLFNKYLNITPIFVGPGVKTGIRIISDNPKEVGADLVSSANAVINEYADTAIVVDMGTATTFTYIEKKVIKGVAITAGLVTQRDAITKNASQLSQFEFKTPTSVLGGNTVDCLNAGLLYGHSKMVEGIINEIKSELKIDPVVIITGGASRFVKDLLPTSYKFDDLLILKGLVNIYRKNHKK